MATQDKFNLTISDSASQLIRENPGLEFSASDLRDINSGVLVPLDPATPFDIPPVFVPPGPSPAESIRGCIRRLRYETGSDDLHTVQFKSGVILNKNDAGNLNDFREVFQTAANFGMRVTGCLYTNTKKLRMVNLIPCKCRCKCDCQD